MAQEESLACSSRSAPTLENTDTMDCAITVLAALEAVALSGPEHFCD